MPIFAATRSGSIHGSLLFFNPTLQANDQDMVNSLSIRRTDRPDFWWSEFSTERVMCQPRRAIISLLISAMGFAGFGPFGQERVQFLTVWQR
jgi:hypothetical protein